MLNKFLHALTNRTSLSDNPLFVPDPTFIPANLPTAAIQLRQALGLDKFNTDYYLKASAAVLNLFPDIAATLQDSNTSYDVKDFCPNGVQSLGGNLVSNGLLNNSYTDIKPTALPAPLTYNIIYGGPGTVQLQQVETGGQTVTNVIVSHDSVGTLLQISWPADWPFTGAVRANQTWQAGAQITFIVEPSRFPYSAAVRAMQASAYFQSLLMKYNMQSVFQNAVDVKKKMALGLAVIAVANPAVYPQFQ